MIVTFDLETSIHNKGNPFDTRNFIVSAHIKSGAGAVACHFYDEPDFKTQIRNAFGAASLLVGVNLKFDLQHCRNLGIELPAGVRVWDCMLAEFILSGQTSSFAGLNQLAQLYGLGSKDDAVAEYWDKGVSTEDIPRDVVEAYGNLDVELSYAVYLKQLSDARMSPALHKLILLDGLDLVVLADMEWNGFLFNVEGSTKRADELNKELVELDEELFSYSPHRFNLASGEQLSCFLFGGQFTEDRYSPVSKTYKSGPRKGEQYVRNEYQGTDTYRFGGHFKPIKGSEVKKSTDERKLYSVAEDVLSQLKAKTKEQRRIVELLARRAYISKLCGTYLMAMPALIETMHWADNYIHGQFNQVVVVTGRLSSSRPNMQNAPEDVDEFYITRYQ